VPGSATHLSGADAGNHTRIHGECGDGEQCRKQLLTVLFTGTCAAYRIPVLFVIEAVRLYRGFPVLVNIPE